MLVSKKAFYIICLLSITINPLQVSLSKPHLFEKTSYQPTFEFSLKGGNQRTVGRTGAVLPLQNSDRGLWFTSLWGLWDSDAAKEWNVGLGYRHRCVDWIVGAYGFFDRRLSTLKHYHSQLTFGAELLGENLETRINGYIPMVSAKAISMPLVDKANRVSLIWANLLEKPLGGVDIEVGGTLTPCKTLQGFLAYYHFNGSSVKAIDGMRIRGQLQLTNYVALTGEASYDRLRKECWFAGMQLNFRLGAIEKREGLSQKMTQMVIRDIDIIIQAGEQTIAIDTQTAIPIESYADLDKIRNNLSGHYIVTKDIIAIGQKHSPIGSKETPFTGIIVGISDDKSQLKLREIRGLILEENQSNFGLFGYVDHACIGYLSICHQSFHLFNNEQPYNSNGLHSYTVGALAGGAQTHNLFIHNRNLSHLSGTKAFVGGLVGHAISYNKFIYNRNYGTLTITAKEEDTYLGGIVGLARENNMLAHNLNIGTIMIQPIELKALPENSHVGGIVGSAYNNNILTNGFVA